MKRHMEMLVIASAVPAGDGDRDGDGDSVGLNVARGTTCSYNFDG